MATQEKLQKSLDTLKNLSQLNAASVDVNKKKEKIQHCYIITEAVSNPTIRIATDFHRILGNIVEIFLRLTDDPESDVRMTAEECLNRIIRASHDGYIGKIQIELHKEIKKNGATRTLRTALWLFSMLTHHIRPHKGKAYVTNLFPNLIKITERTEESVHETLALSLPRILKVLSCFTTENEMKALLKAFLSNIGNVSAVIRRTATTSVLNICLNCRKPSTFLSYCLVYLLDLLIPISINQASPLILGVLYTIKILIPHIYNNNLQETELNVITDKLLQVFEVCLHYLSHSDHNIVNVSLETLQVLISNCDKSLKKHLFCEKGWGFNRIISRSKSALSKHHSPSELSIATNVTGEDSLFSESELTETLRNDIETWIDGSRLSVINSTIDRTKDRSESLNVVNAFDSGTAHSEEIQLGQFVSKIKSRSVGDNLDSLTKSDASSFKSLSESIDDRILDSDDIQEIDIGDLLHNDLPIAYCTRLITTRFLLKGTPGGTISDKTVRVSVKHLALSCLSSIFRLYPSGLFLWLDRNYASHSMNKGISNQNVSDIFLYRHHIDPQLRGAVRNLAANFIKTVCHSSEDGYDEWLERCAVPGIATMFQGKEIIDIFVQGLKDESSSCIRQTLLSLDVALPYLLESKFNHSSVTLLEVLPLLAHNPYWLVKVALCELVANMDYASVFYLLNNNSFQQKVIYNVLFELLDDSDQRVRSAAAIAIKEIIPHLYFEEFKINETTVTSRAIQQSFSFLKLIERFEVGSNIHEQHFIENMPFPFNKVLDKVCDKSDFSLSKIIYRLCNILSTTTSKHLISGGIETLSLLSEEYPCTVYRSSWGINGDNTFVEEIPDLLRLCVSFLVDTDHVYDIQTHINLLKLSSNLYSGHAVVSVKPLVDVNIPQSIWSMFLNESLSQISEQYLTHAVKMLNIFHHVLNDMVPTVQSQPKNVLSNLPAPGNLSPMKRRKSDLDKKLLVTIKTEKDDKNEKKDGSKPNSTMTSFSCSTRYLRIFDILKTAFVNYKISLDSDSSQKFLELLVANLRMLSVLMEVGTINEFSRIAEDILNCFRSTFNLDASTTVSCVEQLLKCLFGTNLTVNISELSFRKYRKTQKEEENDSFYHNMFQKPYNLVVEHFSSLSNPSRTDLDNENTIMGYLHRKGIKRGSVILLKSSDKILANYIRIFEPMVIKSLKQYTVTSDVSLQCQVLQLLNQLVRLRVNYCLLDSEQVFIGFVLKQFEFIEEGQIPLAEELIPKIFQFLVQLSYSRQHSKSIIGIPKIIQLCDGLMASGQPSTTHCIPALQPLVEDIFLGRNKSNTSDTKELETTREVVLSMLLRLWEDRKVMDLITLILEDSKYCTDNSEKWFEWSKRVFAVVFPIMKQNKLKLENFETLVAMKKLILTLNPEVFKPFDDVIATLFQDPPYMDADMSSFNNWLSKINILLLIILPIKEDFLINKIDQLKSEFSPNSIYENVVAKADPLNVYNNADTFGKIQSETVFVRMIFRVISLIAERTWWGVKTEEKCFLAEQFSVFLLHCICLFQFGSHCKISTTAVSVLKRNISKSNQDFIDISGINANMMHLSTFKPLVTFYWTYLISLLNYKDRAYYSNFLVQSSIEKHFKNPSINKEITRTGCLISLCDFLCDNTSESELLQWFLATSSANLVELCEEGPVFEFITFLHRNSKLSGTFLRSVSSLALNNPVYEMKLLKCVEHSHANRSGQVLKLLIPNLLKTQEAVSRNAVNLASRKIELLLTMPPQEVVEQFSNDDLDSMRAALMEFKLIQKHEALVSLLNKLCGQYFGLNPVEFERRRVLDPNEIKQLTIDRRWYLNQVTSSKDFIKKDTIQLLDCLEKNEIVDFMSSSYFEKTSLRDCLKLGLSSTKTDKESVLLNSTVEYVFKEIAEIVKKVQIKFENNSHVNLDQKEEFQSLFNEDTLIQLLNDIASCVPVILSIDNISDLPNHVEDLIKFAATSLEYLQYILSRKCDFPVGQIEILLTCADAILQNSIVSRLLDTKENLYWFCSLVNSFFQLVEILLKLDKPLPSVPNYFPKQTEDIEAAASNEANGKSIDLQPDANADVFAARDAVHRLYTLVCWFAENKCINRTNIPQFLFDRIKTVTISLSRLSVANSYLLVPFKAWKTGWTPETVSGTYGTQIPAMPIEILQDVDVLKEYIFRVNFLGWTTRQQFEETWMGLLSIFCYPLDNMDALELNEILHSSSLAIKSITSLLLTTLTCSDIGSPVADLLHVSRNSSIPDNSISTKKLRKIQDSIEKCYKECSSLPPSNFLNVFNSRNFEKLGDKYGYGQLSVKYFLITTDVIKGTEIDKSEHELIIKRRKLLEDNGLDLNSCLQFLLDYYTQLMRPQTSTHIRVLHEAIRSTVVISDLFMEKSHFMWMMEIFLELSKMHTVEDELLHQYLIVGICKAVSILNPEMEIYEQVKRMLTQYLKSPYLSSRMACLYGLLYLLEGCKLHNITIGSVSEEMQLILPCAVEYIQFNLNPANSVLKKSQEHFCLVWSLSFYLLENIEESHMEQNFVSTTLNAAFNLLSGRTNIHLHQTIIKGLERLLIVKKTTIIESYGKLYLKLALEKIKSDNPTVALMATQLLLSYLYTDCAEHFENAQGLPASPDHLVQTIEKISAIFERIKKGYAHEVEILSYVLPNILDDFFSPSDVLTKVIGEFLSPQQPHPKLLSKVVFQVFESAIKKDQHSLLQDWVVFSLSNFTQSFSIGMATWCLTCFFISASSNPWLRCYFPYVQTRVGRYEYEDRKMLCIAGADFYKALKSDKQKTTFVETFSKVKDQPDTPFNDLLLSL